MSHHYLVVCLFFSSLLCAPLRAQDTRNTVLPNTDTHFTFTPPATLAEWKVRREVLRQQVLASAGLLPMPEKKDMHPLIFGKIEHPDYTIEKVALDTLPGYFLGGNLYRPTTAGKHPAILVSHGHWPYGRLQNDDICATPALAASLAREGFIVFLYDMVGYNDTMQTPHRFGGEAEQLWGFGPLGLQLWNSIRSVDFLLSLSDVEPSMVGITGASGGGTQAILLGAVDDRIAFSAPVNMVSAYMQGGDDCENAPGLRAGTNNVELAALMAPRPMFVVSATGDWTKHVPQEEFPAIQSIYKLYGKADNVGVTQIDAPHNYNQKSREAVEQFLGKTILNSPSAGQFKEKSVPVEGLAEMLVWQGKSLPTDALNYKQLFELWRQMAARQVDAISEMDRLRDVLAVTVGVEWPTTVVDEKGKERDHIVLGRKGDGDTIPAYWRKRGKTAVLILDPEGLETARKSVQTRRLMARNSVLIIDAFQTASAVADRDRTAKHFLTFNHTDDTNRVQDVLTALRFLDQQHFTSIQVVASGKAAWWAEFASAIAPTTVKLKLELPASSLVDTEEAFLANFNVPGVLRAGGLRTADRLLKAADRIH